MRPTLLALLLFAAFTAPASAEATASPNTTGAATALHFGLDATQPPISGRIPTQIVLSLQQGFRLDPAAVAKRCTSAQASRDACPKRARVGSALVVASYAGTDYQVPVKLYLAKPQRKGDIAGVAAVATVLGSTQAFMGRVVKGAAPYGLSVILATPGGDLSAFPVTFKSFTADVGPVARRVKKKRHVLLRTPKTCTGAWAANAVFTFPDASTATVDAPIPCVA